MRYRFLHGIYCNSKQNIHSSGVLKARTINSVNNTVCLTATLIGIRVVVGGWKNLVFTIQIRKPRDSSQTASLILILIPILILTLTLTLHCNWSSEAVKASIAVLIVVFFCGFLRSGQVVVG